jgi:hypothetical protein
MGSVTNGSRISTDFYGFIRIILWAICRAGDLNVWVKKMATTDGHGL